MSAIVIRKITLADAEAALAIYAPHIKSHVSFEYEVPSLTDYKKRIEKVITNFPWYVATVDDVVIGFAYAGLFRERAAYAWALETSIYVAEDFQGNGPTPNPATLLYEKVFEDLRQKDVKQVIGVISLPNEKSVRFHEKMGFKSIGVFPSVGFKLDQWWDVLFMTKPLQDLPFSKPMI